MALQRPLKEGNVRTYQEKVALNFKDILASEADGDHDTMYAAWNGALGGDLTGTLPAPTVTAAAKSKWSDTGTALTPVTASRNVTLGGGTLFETPRGTLSSWSDAVDLSANANISPQFDAAKPSWLFRQHYTGDYAQIQRAPAGSPTSWASLFTFENTGSFSMAGNLRVYATNAGATGFLQFERAGASGYFFSNQAYNPVDLTLASWHIQMDCASNGWFNIYRRAANAAGGTMTQTAYVKDNGDFGVIGANAYKASGTTWANPSDPRLKDDVAPYAAGLAEVCQLAPISYRLKAQRDGPLCYGFDASAVRDVFPECVSTTRMKLDPADEEETDDVLVFDMHPILVALVNAVRELAAKVAP